MKQYLRLLLPVFLVCFISSTRAQTGNDNPTGVTGDYSGNITTGGSYDPYTGNSKRFLDELTVTGSVGVYPLKWTRVLNTRGGGASLGNGGAWSHSYAWGLWVRPPGSGGSHIIGSNGDPMEYQGPDGMVSFPDGREVLLYTDDGVTYRVADNQGEPSGHLDNLPDGNFDWVMADGGRVQFRHPAGSTSGGFVAVAIVDLYGLTTTLEYDSHGLSKITEPAGRYLQLNYQRFVVSSSPNSYIDVISSVQAFDGRGNLIETVNYHYDQEYASGEVNVYFYNLAQVDYGDGNHAYYTYYPAADATNSWPDPKSWTGYKCSSAGWLIG